MHRRRFAVLGRARVPAACAGLCLGAFKAGEAHNAGRYRPEGVAAVRKYVEFLRAGDVDGAYGMLCPKIVARGGYTVADHRAYLRGRPAIGTVGAVEGGRYSSSMDPDRDVRAFEEDFEAVFYALGARVCDARGWAAD
ncbi:hypothetical protein [Dactylosporangium sp. CS-033363]|uniref:hypothetical protein n=1 Tax=Dactylosporangium sp. CS-033363 TaxID=3239935 RepID=UPI003D908FF9